MEESRAFSTHKVLSTRVTQHVATVQYPSSISLFTPLLPHTVICGRRYIRVTQHVGAAGRSPDGFALPPPPPVQVCAGGASVCWPCCASSVVWCLLQLCANFP